MPSDSPKLRSLLSDILSSPKLVIDGVAKESGQRVVYFCHFEQGETIGDKWCVGSERPENWGAVVLKVSEGGSAASVAYLQKEIKILQSIESANYPELLIRQYFRRHIARFYY